MSELFHNTVYFDAFSETATIAIKEEPSIKLDNSVELFRATFEGVQDLDALYHRVVSLQLPFNVGFGFDDVTTHYKPFEVYERLKYEINIDYKDCVITVHDSSSRILSTFSFSDCKGSDSFLLLEIAKMYNFSIDDLILFESSLKFVHSLFFERFKEHMHFIKYIVI